MVKVSLYLIIIGVLSCSKHVDKQQQYETIPLAEGDLIFRKGIGTKTQAVVCSGVYVFPSDIYTNKEFQLIYNF